MKNYEIRICFNDGENVTSKKITPEHETAVIPDQLCSEIFFTIYEEQDNGEWKALADATSVQGLRRRYEFYKKVYINAFVIKEDAQDNSCIHFCKSKDEALNLSKELIAEQMGMALGVESYDPCDIEGETIEHALQIYHDVTKTHNPKYFDIQVFGQISIAIDDYMTSDEPNSIHKSHNCIDFDR